jgi:hypothetical protein
VVGEISKCIEREGIRRIAHIIVPLNEVVVVLEHSDPVEPFSFRRVSFAMFFAPRFEQLGGV